MIKIIYLAALLLAAGVTSGWAQTVSGSYKAQGKNDDGSSYSGTVEIRAKSATDCRITWMTDADNKPTQGICLLLGNVFSASWVSGGPGLALYAVNSDGTLDGTWTIEGASGIGTERLKPTKPSAPDLPAVTGGAAPDLNGSYKMQGKDEGGASYSGTAEIRVKSPADCRITWSPDIRALCLQRGNVFAASYKLRDTGLPVLAVYAVKQDGTLEGTWFQGGPGVGTERLEPTTRY